ncbi:MAG: MerR family transcriptional regulator [Burkholderiales bacterium]
MSTLYRSGAVARMLRMPVATLRVWERRYALTDSERSASGQRLYNSADVQRLALMKQLSDLGHAIGQLAGLSMGELQAVANTHAGTLAAQRGVNLSAASSVTGSSLSGSTTAPPSWALAGPAAEGLLRRLQRPAVRRQLGADNALPVLWQAGSKSKAASAAEPMLSLMVHVYPQLPEASALPLASASRHALLYRFGSENQAQQLLAAGVLLLCEPQPDAALASWLSLLLQQPSQAPITALAPGGPSPRPRRWDDAALADFAGLSTTVACECPRHLAEIVMQLSHFEAYCASCEAQSARSPTDAALHAELGRLTATARSLFEQGLEQVARHEGLLPRP